MHPNLFLRTFWQSSFRPQVFVAMSFAGVYQTRFDEVIAPAIASVSYRDSKLTPLRVDLTKTGDSILTDIMDGIAHSALILADVSVLGRDSKTGQPHRNGNVMYEVGLALACRQPAEVLLLRDDRDSFLFDVSTVPHMNLDFSDTDAAREKISAELRGRLNEVDKFHDARVALAVASLTAHEWALLDAFSKFDTTHHFSLPTKNVHLTSAMPRLLDKGLIRTVSITSEGYARFAWTELGYSLAKDVAKLVPRESPQAVSPPVEAGKPDTLSGTDSAA
ncbi:MAG: hypothetical protein IH627_17790 [Rubrivivax sp.]|nr:hypothetical protein [Rubrivivax sp.]